jgi:hypothetical protein
MPSEPDWVELVRVHDRFQADVTVRFLEDHDVPVQTSGGANTALPMMGLTDVRILVPRDELERATQALEAMRGGRAQEHPFRDQPPEAYDAPVAKRKPAFAFMLALLVPIGGGHFYARHGAAGTIFAAGIIGIWFAAFFWNRSVVYTCALLVVLDAVLAPFAVRRANADRIPSDGRQRLWGVGGVVLAWVLAPIVYHLVH